MFHQTLCTKDWSQRLWQERLFKGKIPSRVSSRECNLSLCEIGVTLSIFSVKLKTRHVYSYSSTNFSSHLLPIQGHIYFIGIVNKPTTLLLEQNSFPLNYTVVSLSILQFIGVFPKWNRNSAIPGNLINHWSMNWSRYKDPVSHMCLAGTVVASWFSTQETAGLNPFTIMSYFCDWIHSLRLFLVRW